MKSFSRVTVRAAPGGSPNRGLLQAGDRVYPCLLGKNGISVEKREGDLKTPAGRFRLMFALYRCDRLNAPATFLPLGAITEKDGWCDQSGHPNYNRPVKLPFSASHEVMMRDDGLYDIVVVLDHNYSKRVRNNGSAVFFHLTAGKDYTAGCIAVDKRIMLRLLPRLSNKTVMEIIA